MKIFAIQDGVLVLDREEIALIKEFNNVLRRVIPCEDDPTGRLKVRAFQEFNYIYSICDYNSYPNKNGLSEEEAHYWAVDNAGLPPDWKPDQVVFEAMQAYSRLVDTPSRELSRELLISIRNTYKIVRKVREKVDEKLEHDELDNSDIDELISYQNKLMAIADKVPSMVNSLKNVIEMIDKEEDINKEYVRGGNEIDESMNPDTSINYE